MPSWGGDRLAAHGLLAVEHRKAIPGAPQNLTGLYDETLAEAPERVAIVGRSGSLSFAALEAQVNAACGYLAGLGVRASDRVAASLVNDIDIVVAFLAVQRIGAIWVGINRAYALGERRHFLTDAEVSVLVAEPAIAAETATIAHTLPGLRHVIVLNALDARSSEWHRGLQSHSGTGRPDVEIDPFAPAAITYTSGTTGLAKGVVHSQHNILVAATVAEVMAVDSRPEVIRGISSPLTILNLMILGPVATLARGRRTVCMDRIDVLGIVEWVRRERVNTLTLVPASLNDLLTRPEVDQRDLDSLTWVVVGAGAVPEGMARLYRRRFGHDVTVSYGLTENPATVSRSDAQTRDVPGAVGWPLFHLEVAILDDAGRPARPVTHGEVCVRAAREGSWAHVYTPALGYWKDAEATAELLKDGWLHTDDIGFLDEAGQLYIQGRRGDVISRGGANIYPAEVERVLRQEPGLQDCAVTGVPDARLGQTLAAYIQPSPGVTGAELIERLRQRCATEIARYKTPVHWIIVDVMPRNTMGKVVKGDLPDIMVPHASRAAESREETE
jgi:acyl-CoA synthetase (AMP-forming)/AMP-acid ligase II